MAPKQQHADNGGKAKFLVYGVFTVALTSSVLASFLVKKLSQSVALSGLTFGGTLWWWVFRVAGGAAGISRAVASGEQSIGTRFATGNKKDAHVRVVVVSDTHMRHDKMGSIPKGDLFIHCGDLTMNGTREELSRVVEWLRTLVDFKHKVVVPGNHDYILQGDSDEAVEARAQLASVCTLLIDSGCTISGLSVYGSPWTPPIPRRPPMAFQTSNLEPFWEKIPAGVDILVTHGPPKNHLDRILLGYHVGCERLAHHVEKRIRPRFSFFGHIHEGFGSETVGPTVFCNAAISNLMYKPTHAIPVFDIPVLAAKPD